jgi:hypothetical protein
VLAGEVVLLPGLFTNTQTFFTSLVDSFQNLTQTNVHYNSQTFYSPDVGRQFITPDHPFKFDRNVIKHRLPIFTTFRR